MGPIPDDSLGCIFTEKPRILLNCTLWAPEWPPQAGVQLVSGPRPGRALEQSLPGAEREKPPASSVPKTAGHLSGEISTNITAETNKKPGLSQRLNSEIANIFASVRITTKSVYSTMYSQAVTHPSTNMAQCCLTSVIRRELVFSTWYGRRHKNFRKIWIQ